MLFSKIFRTLKEYSIWISNTPSQDGDRQPTAFQRVKQTWMLVWPLALKVMSPTQIMPDEAGLVFTYSTRRVSGHKIEFADLKNLTKSFMTKGKQELLELLPSKLDAEELNVRESDLKDNMAFTESIFEQNATVFDPLVDKVFEWLREEGEERYPVTKQKGRTALRDMWLDWLEKEEELVESILGGVSLSSGIPGRGIQMADFRHASSKEGKRNLFICKSNVVIGFTKSKSFNRTIQEALWALPPGLSQIVLIYLGIIRPVSIRLMGLLCQKSNYLSRTHIFVTAQSANSSASARSQRINAFIQSQTLSALKVRLSVSTLRQLITAIFRKHLSDLIDPVNSTTTSIVNRQADHTQKTADHYGQNAGSMTGLMLSDTEIDQFMESSHGWQALLGIISPGQKMQERLYKIPAVCLREGNQMIAMDRVRSGLCRKYGIGGPCWETSQTKAGDMLRMKPFMPKAEDERLGDEMLIHVVSALIYGHGKPGPKEAAPVNGYSVETITEAVALIRLGLKEWTGPGRAHFNPQDLSVKTSIELFKRGVYKNVTELSITEEEKWMELGLRVFKYTTELYGLMKGPNLMDDQDNMDVD